MRSVTRSETETTKAIQASGARVIGSVRAPLNTPDFSSFLLQAQASGAKVLALATAGTDLRNCVKQAAEFGLTRSGLRIACLSMQMNDVISLGQKATAGMVYTDSFYWDMERGGPGLGDTLQGQVRLVADAVSRGHVLLGAALAEGRQGNQYDRGRRGRRQHEGDADQRHVQ